MTTAQKAQGDLIAFLGDLREDFRAVAQTLSALAERMARVEANVSSIADRQEEAGTHERRITALESGAATLTSEMQRRVSHLRWLIGTLVVALVGITAPVVGWVVSHLAWR